MTYLSKGGITLEFSAKYASPLGPLVLRSDGEHLTGLYLNREEPAQETDLPVFRITGIWLDAYFQGQTPMVEVPMKLEGTDFQLRVWRLLLTIPFGQVRTYGDIARELAKIMGKEKMSAQAVGQAVGKNPISILVPCHRVIGAKDKLTGYGGGMENKRWLLRHEGWQTDEKRIW